MTNLSKEDGLEDWWPTPLAHIPQEEPMSQEYVTIGEISSGARRGSTKYLYTAIVSPHIVEQLLTRPGGVANTPHETELWYSTPRVPDDPDSGRPEYVLRGAEIAEDGLEPIVVAYKAGNGRTVLMPDQHMVGQMQLVPRFVEDDPNLVLHWDDLDKPEFDVVRALMVSHFHYDLKCPAKVMMRTRTLQAYADGRRQALVQVYYERNFGPNLRPDGTPYTKSEFGDFLLPGRFLGLGPDRNNDQQVIAEVWGVRHLLDPSPRPQFNGGADYGTLQWPGVSEAVTKETARHLGLKYVYVKDEVLGVYEDRPEDFSVNPETGSVYYGGQWGVSYCRRIGRNLIMVEVKKLYEGVPPEVIQHWHKYAVEKPSGSLAWQETPNVASRCKCIVCGMARLGESLATIAGGLGLDTKDSSDFVGFSRSDLNSEGWYRNSRAKLISRHLRPGIPERVFTERCLDLGKVATDGFNEALIRQVVTSFGFPTAETKEFKALKLLELLAVAADVALETGLDFFRNSTQILARVQEKRSQPAEGQSPLTPVGFLFLLRGIRNQGAHSSGMPSPLLKRLGIRRNKMKAGWDDAIDEIYDRTADAMWNTAELLECAAISAFESR